MDFSVASMFNCRHKIKEQTVFPTLHYLAITPMDIDDDNARQLRPEQDKEWTRLWRTWRTVLEMLVDRVCATPDHAIRKVHTD